jgi:RNA polymerase sigma factor (sigma-70 family)
MSVPSAGITTLLKAWRRGNQKALDRLTPLVYDHSLAQLDPRRAQVVELRFFGGLSVEETADALSVSAQTVMRDWKLARAWLGRELRR